MMPGQICARCGAPRRVPATHFIEYPNPDTDAPAYLHLCKACAREAAEIIRLYGEGAPIVDLGIEDTPSMLMPEIPQATIEPLPGLQITLSGEMADRVTEVNVKIPPQEASE